MLYHRLEIKVKHMNTVFEGQKRSFIRGFCEIFLMFLVVFLKRATDYDHVMAVHCTTQCVSRVLLNRARGTGSREPVGDCYLLECNRSKTYILAIGALLALQTGLTDHAGWAVKKVNVRLLLTRNNNLSSGLVGHPDRYGLPCRSCPGGLVVHGRL